MWSLSVQETWYSESSQVRTTHNAGIHDQLACILKNCFWTNNWAAAYRYVIYIIWSPLKMRQFCRLGYDRWIYEDGLGQTSKPDNNNNIWKFCPPQHAEEECIAWWFQGMNGGNICSPFSAGNPAYIVEIIYTHSPFLFIFNAGCTHLCFCWCFCGTCSDFQCYCRCQRKSCLLSPFRTGSARGSHQLPVVSQLSVTPI